MKSFTNDTMYELLVKCFLGEASPEEQRFAEQWKADDPEHRKLAADIERILKESRQLATRAEVDADAAWNRFRSRKNQLPATEEPEKKEAVVVPFRQRKYSWQVAAVWVLLAGIAMAGAYWFILSEKESYASGFTAMNVELPDDSKVAINKSSELEYASSPLSGERKVKLKGEAFFSIKKSSKPFRIYVNDVTITVLGTSFYVDGRKEETEVQVETGLVQVIRGTDTLLLHPGEKVLLSGQVKTPEKQVAHGKLYEVFVNGEIVCDNTPLRELVEVLRYEYGAIIEFGDEEAARIPITTTFKNMSLNEILDVVQQTLNVRIDRKDNKYLIRS